MLFGTHIRDQEKRAELGSGSNVLYCRNLFLMQPLPEVFSYLGVNKKLVFSTELLLQALPHRAVPGSMIFLTPINFLLCIPKGMVLLSAHNSPTRYVRLKNLIRNDPWSSVNYTVFRKHQMAIMFHQCKQKYLIFFYCVLSKIISNSVASAEIILLYEKVSYTNLKLKYYFCPFQNCQCHFYFVEISFLFVCSSDEPAWSHLIMFQYYLILLFIIKQILMFWLIKDAAK